MTIPTMQHSFVLQSHNHQSICMIDSYEAEVHRELFVHPLYTIQYERLCSFEIKCGTEHPFLLWDLRFVLPKLIFAWNESVKEVWIYLAPHSQEQ